MNKVMKANEAPENIYYTPTEGGFYLTTCKPEPPFAEGVEYTRTDAFVKKAVSFIRNCTTYDGLGYKAKCVDIEKLIEVMKR